VHQPAGRAVGVDRHTADRIGDEPAVGRLPFADRREELDRFTNVPQRFAAPRFVKDAGWLGCQGCGVRGEEHLASARDPRYTRGEVDGRSEVVAVALHRRPVMESDAHQGERDGLMRSRDAQNEGIADGLYVLAASGRQLSLDRVAEVRYQGCRFLVPVRLGQGGEAGDVGE
jgi:hypothetical protein